jgi:diacylglycerol kinase family enzyme
MNSQWIGSRDLGPRSHPGDGLVDITTGSLGWRQRRAALARSATGTHLPHPSLNYRRVRSETLTFDRPVSLCIDGALQRKGQTVSLCVEPDAFHVVV